MGALDGFLFNSYCTVFSYKYLMLNLKQTMLFQIEEYDRIEVYYGAAVVSGHILIYNILL